MLVSLSSSGLFFFGAVVFLLGLFHSIDAQPVNPAPPGQTVANLEVKSVDHGFCLESAGKRPLPYPSTGASLPAGTLVEFEEISGTWTVEQFTIRNSVGYTNYLGYGTPLTHCTSVELTKGALVMRVDCDNGSIQYTDISMLNYNLQCTGKVSFGIWDSDLGNNNGSIKFKILATPPYWQAGAWQTNCNGQCGKMITQTRTVQCMEQVNFAAAIPIPDIYCANAGEKPATSQPFTCRC